MFELVYVLLSAQWRARGASGRLIDISDVCEHVWARMLLWTETDDNILDQQEAVISGAGEKERHECGRDVPLRM